MSSTVKDFERTMPMQLWQSKDMDWATPQSIVDELEQEFGKFDLDPAASHDNAKAPAYYTVEDNGLDQEWYGLCFLNPPYGTQISKWIAKARHEAEAGRATVVALIPARTDTRYWHEHIFDVADEIRFLKGRVHFTKGDVTGPATFPSAIIVWRAKE